MESSSSSSCSLSFFPPQMPRPRLTSTILLTSTVSSFWKQKRPSLQRVSAISYQKFIHFSLDQTKRRTHLLPSPLQVLTYPLFFSLYCFALMFLLYLSKLDNWAFIYIYILLCFIYLCFPWLNNDFLLKFICAGLFVESQILLVVTTKIRFKYW